MEALMMLPNLKRIKVTDVLNNAVRRNLIRRQALKERLTQNDADFLAEAIDYKSAANVDDAIGQAANWVKRKVGDREYALVVIGGGSEDIGSGEWLAHRAIESIGHWPAAVVSSEEDFDQAYQSGIRTFVGLEDATYSGSDATKTIQFYQSFIDQLTPPRARRYVHFYLACGFASARARQLIDKSLASLKKGTNAEFYACRSLKPFLEFRDAVLALPSRQQRRVVRFLNHVTYPNQKGASYTSYEPIIDPKPSMRFYSMPGSMSMLAHKVPNYASFPSKLGSILEPRLVPPYKKKIVRPTPPVHAYSKNGARYHVHPMPNNWYHHAAFTNAQGELHYNIGKSKVLRTVHP